MLDSTRYLESNRIIYRWDNLESRHSDRLEMELEDGSLNPYMYYVEGGYDLVLGLFSVGHDSSRSVILARVRKCVSALSYLNRERNGLGEIVKNYVGMVLYESGIKESLPSVDVAIGKGFEDANKDDFNPIQQKHFSFKREYFNLSKEERRIEINRFIGYIYSSKTLKNLNHAVYALVEMGYFVNQNIVRDYIEKYFDVSLSVKTIEKYWSYVKPMVDKHNKSSHGYLNLNDKKKTETIDALHKAGEEIHYVDREIISKTRVRFKSGKNARTVSKHWSTLEPDFNSLNEKLKNL